LRNWRNALRFALKKQGALYLAIKLTNMIENPEQSSKETELIPSQSRHLVRRPDNLALRTLDGVKELLECSIIPGSLNSSLEGKKGIFHQKLALGAGQYRMEQLA